jgi:hypothetical protein
MFRENLSCKTLHKNRVGGVAQGESLSSSPSTSKKKKRKEKKKWGKHISCTNDNSFKKIVTSFE